MKVGILGSPRGWHVQALRQALERRGIAVACLPITKLVARLADRPWVRSQEEPLDDYNALFVRAIPGGSLEQVIFRVDVLHRLENAGIRIVNPPTTIERTVDKYYTSSLLEDARLPTPRTVVTERFDEALLAFQELGGDVVVKPLFGSEGRGMVRVSDQDTAYRVFRALELGGYVYYLQEFIPHHNEDIRAFVIGDRVVAAMVRRSDSWKTNVAQGAEAEPLTLSAELEEMSLRAARVLGADYAGVDILRSEDGDFYVTEVNGIPGWAKLQKVTGVDVAELVVQYVIG
ncbi:MAG: RimK family alpha-L-glutamate ligase [Anaerolineae bacterium]|jgi:RimK family alpha-L-glutamate ligase|nr:RimK family alpha-L-glutamate ligase [Anaerolineae bacterium]MDH7475613.1 RimK family alpha-L-glutamate ligase [Anaerolineae bacterium]